MNSAVMAQRLLRLDLRRGGWRRIDIAHVGLTVSSAGFIHSMPDKGVHTSTWDDLRGRETSIVVLRHKKAECVNHEVLNQAVEAFGLKYNFLFDAKAISFLQKRLAERVFCSELIDRFYTRGQLGLPVSRRFIHPQDLKELLHHPDWIEVTADYLPYIRGEVPDVGGRDVLAMVAMTNGLLRDGRLLIRKGQALNEELDQLQREVQAQSAKMRDIADQIVSRRAAYSTRRGAGPSRR